MAAIVTAPPILIDPATYSRQSNAEINPMFYPPVGSNLYQSLARNIGGGGQLVNAVNAFLSSDTAATWAIENVAGSPGHRDSYFSFRAGIIRCAIIDGLDDATVTPFDTGTNTWGSPSTILSLSASVNGIGAQLFDKPNGDVVLVFMIGTALQIGVLTAGAWTGPTTILTVTNRSYITGGVCDSTGAIHLTFGRGSDDEYFYLRLDNTLSPGSPIDLGPGDTLRTDLRFFGTGLAISYSSIDNKSHVAISPSLASPSFTDYVIYAATGSQQVSYSSLAFDSTGKLTNFYVLTDYSGPSPYVDQIDMSTFDGTSWSAPVLFYDEPTNPPANSSPPIDQYIHTMDVLDQFSNGQWIASTAMELSIPGEVCAGHILVSPAALPLTLPCPLITSPAVVGQPFTETLIASGGTPPYTYSVAVGYTLPPGLTLDPTTGIISGIPTEVGDFEVAYTVTDSLGNTAQTIGTCPIPIGQQGSPCSNPATNPALDSYLELRKVLVAWKKETHLPVRGKS